MKTLLLTTAKGFFPSVGLTAVLGDLITLPDIFTHMKPETTKSLEVGFDLRMLKDRIRLSLTYYKTKDR